MDIKRQNTLHINEYFEDIFQKLDEISKNLTNFSIENKTLTPMWKAFLFNDGSMTTFLSNLFIGLKFNLISSEKTLYADTPELNLIMKLIGLSAVDKIAEDKIVKRIIDFSYENKIIMEGLSYWNLEIYNGIFGDQLSLAIGKALIQKEIEFYKKIDKIFVLNHKESFVFLRISHYNLKGKLAFVLLEIFYPELLFNFLGNIVF